MEKTKIDYTLDSREVAEMIEKQHKNLMRDIKRYLSDFNELNIEPVDFLEKMCMRTRREKIDRVIKSLKMAVSLLLTSLPE